MREIRNRVNIVTSALAEGAEKRRSPLDEIRDAALQVHLSGREEHVLPALLEEHLHAGVRLVEQPETPHQGPEVPQAPGLQGHPQDGRHKAPLLHKRRAGAGRRQRPRAGDVLLQAADAWTRARRDDGVTKTAGLRGKGEERCYGAWSASLTGVFVVPFRLYVESGSGAATNDAASGGVSRRSEMRSRYHSATKESRASAKSLALA